jgi:hypothetical protein
MIQLMNMRWMMYDVVGVMVVERRKRRGDCGPLTVPHTLYFNLIWLGLPFLPLDQTRPELVSDPNRAQ